MAKASKKTPKKNKKAKKVRKAAAARVTKKAAAKKRVGKARARVSPRRRRRPPRRRRKRPKSQENGRQEGCKEGRQETCEQGEGERACLGAEAGGCCGKGSARSEGRSKAREGRCRCTAGCRLRRAKTSSTSRPRSPIPTACRISATPMRRSRPTRWRASSGSTARTCFFLTGTDEHGLKMIQTAEAEGLPTLDVATRNAAALQADGRAAERLVRPLHPHHRTRASPFGPGDLEPDAAQRRHLPRRLCRLVFGARRGLLRRR